jgi:signal transduction histidine kinase
LIEDKTLSIEKLKTLLEASETEKKALLKLALHDIRSPMNKVFALVGLFKMSDGPLTNEQAGYLNKMELVIRDGLSRMRNLIDLKTIEDGDAHNETFTEHFNVGKLVQRVVREYKADAARKNIEISFKVLDVFSTTDRIYLSRILDQLISNAIKFSPERSNISIEMKSGQNDIIVQITDGGRGIADDEIPMLFKKFTPLSTRTTGGETSTGIGLFIASWMARKIGGSIDYSNNNGSVFALRLPIVSMA